MDYSIFFIFGLVAVLYSSVGFGGGSSYLAFLILFLTDFHEIRTIALCCNIAVVSSNLWLYYKQGLLLPRKGIELTALSIPLAFVAANFRLEQTTFFIILGASLIAASIAMFIQLLVKKGVQKSLGHKGYSRLWNVITGGVIGFISGLVGIGGGIFLSPLLNLLRWDNAKKIAAMASFFILVNSLAGISGLVVSNQFQWDSSVTLPLVLVVFAGGQLGARWSIQKLKLNVVKGITALLVLYVGLRVMLKYQFDIIF